MSDGKPDGNEAGNDRSWLDRLAQLFSNEPKSRAELLDVLHAAQHNDLIDSDALGIFQGAMAVADMQVRDIMIPRSQMVVVKVDQPLEEFLPIIIESNHSRFPVIGDSMDDILGILLAKDLPPLIIEPERREAFDISGILRPVNIVPESKRLNVLLREFRENRNHMAVVIDEFGGVAGLVTIEDVLEEIVGDIEDEYDTDEDLFIRKIGDNDYIVKALTPIDDFNGTFNASLSDEEFDTIGGIVTQNFGYLPERNEATDVGGFHFRVLSADNRQIHLLRMSVHEAG